MITKISITKIILDWCQNQRNHYHDIGDYFSEFGTKSLRSNNEFYNGQHTKTNKINRSIEFGNFANEKVSQYLNEGTVSFD